VQWEKNECGGNVDKYMHSLLNKNKRWW